MSAAVKKPVLTPLELEIMQVLWKEGPSTAAEVVPLLGGNLAYNTVGTMLQVLLRKGRVQRTAEVRAYRYRAAVSRERVAASAIGDLLQRMFGGDTQAMLLAMGEAGYLDADALQQARKALQKAERANERIRQQGNEQA